MTLPVPRSGRTWPARVAVITSVLFLGVAASAVTLWRLEAMSAPIPSVLGLRLGATPDDVRTARPGGDWVTRVESSGDLAVERSGESYSFHEGLLVSVDVQLPTTHPDAAGPPGVLSPGSVLVRERVADGVRVRLVSRACPTHASTAASLVDRVSVP